MPRRCRAWGILQVRCCLAESVLVLCEYANNLSISRSDSVVAAIFFMFLSVLYLGKTCYSSSSSIGSVSGAFELR